MSEPQGTTWLEKRLADRIVALEQERDRAEQMAQDHGASSDYAIALRDLLASGREDTDAWDRAEHFLRTGELKLPTP